MRELEDNKWFPEVLRRHQLDYLSFLATKFKLYQPVAEQLVTMAANSDYKEWTDVCSGSAGPVFNFDSNNNKILLTDMFPPKINLNLPENMSYYPYPVDISQYLPPGNGFITMFNSFHHFSVNEQKEILERISCSRRSFLAVEILQPTFSAFVKVIFTTTIGHWILVPFMRPFSIRRIFFTYLIPIHTITICIDGIISVFKSKSSSYYSALAQSMSTPFYAFSFLKVNGKFGPLYTLVGESIK
jgi:hypothetical protein